MIYYEREPLEEDNWRHPDIRDFMVEHSKRFAVINERKWQEEYHAADGFTKITMLARRRYVKMLMEPGSCILSNITP